MGVELEPAVKVEVVDRMVRQGLEPDVIAATLDMDLREVLTLSRTTTRLTPDDAAIADQTRILMHKALREATLWLAKGTNEQKALVLRPLLSAAARTVGAEKDEEVEGVAAALARLFSEQRNGIPDADQ